jgi:PAS domain S-box-containing protein
LKELNTAGRIKNRRTATRESEERFRTVAETASDAIITIDEDSQIIFVNPATEKIFGYRAENLIGASLTILMPEYLRHLHEAGFARYVHTGEKHLSWEAIELPGLHQDGREIPLELSFGQFTKDARQYFTGIARDITERKRAAEALQHAREERMRELERVRKRIASDLHDDIGSSLTQISLLSEVAQQRMGKADSALTEPLTMIASSSRELVDAMSDIVWAINPQKDHLSHLCQRMRTLAIDVFSASNIEFQFLDPDDEAELHIGANLRREVFLIFKESINNIAKHSRCANARAEFRADNLRMFLLVSDDGCGFDTTSEHDGHGLVSLRERSQAMGGTLELRSQPGVGTTMTLEVPLNEQPGE